MLAEFATWIAVLIYAYEKGGPETTAVLAVAQLLPGVLVGPLAATVTERRSPTTLLAVGYAAQALTMGGTATVLGVDGPPAAI